MSARLLVATLILTALLALVVTPFARRALAPVFRGSAHGPVLDVRAAPEDVAGWRGEVELADGSRLAVELAPLHPDPDRQAFDATALARRASGTRAAGARGPSARDATIGRDVASEARGEPFLCRVTRRSGVRTERGASATDLAWGAIDVHDARGSVAAARGIDAAPDASTEGGVRPVDPLAVLVAPPREPPGVDETCAFLVFGRAPGEGASVRFGGSLDVPLAPTRLAVRAGDAALARVDGKKAANSGVEGDRR